MKTTKKETKSNLIENKYTKKQIINSKTFANNKDLLEVILKENKSYSKKEVNEIIENYKKGKVK